MRLSFLSILIIFQVVSAPVVSYSTHAEENTSNEAIAQLPFPRIAMLWASIRGDTSLAGMAKHDLVMIGPGSLGLKYDREPIGLAESYTSESIDIAKTRIQELRRLNPDIVILGDIVFYEFPDSWLPEDHPWWMRKNGERQQFWPGTHRMDWYNPEYRSHIVKRTLAMKNVGVDGVFYDNLRNEPEAWTTFLKEVREAVGNHFLILANAGYAVGTYDFAAPFLHGIMYESGWSHNRTDWDETIRKMRHTETLLRKPTISLIERFEEIRDRAGWPGDAKRGQKPEPDPAARRWSLCYSLIIGDFFYLFSDNTSHRHDWYPEYDMKIGLPKGEPERINSHTWQRVFDGGLALMNLPGAQESYSIRFDSPQRDAFTGETGIVFDVPAGEGRIFVPIEKP